MKRFFEDKIKQLPKSYYPYAGKSPIHQFLGIKKIGNDFVKNRKKEKVEHYIIRHTGYRPRDLVEMETKFGKKLRILT